MLTVDQAVALLLAWLELRDWKAACERAVPKRKREGGDGDGEDDEGAPEGKAPRVEAAAVAGEAQG